MSTLEVTVERLTILAHPNADALELAQVGLYRAVVRKGQFVTGDLALYIPEQAIVPDALIEELGLTGRLAGPGKNRVKAVRLRGEVSQGIVARPEALSGVNYETALSYREDFSEFFGITKWVPEVPAHMAGLAHGTTRLLPWVDIENIKRYPDIFEDGEQVTASEKVHGTCFISTYDNATREFFVTSKGQAERNLALTEDANNIYWRAARAYDVENFAKFVWDKHEDSHGNEVVAVGVYGEVYGAGVQDLAYGASGKTNKPGYAIFDIQVKYSNGERAWLDQDEVRALANEFGMPMVPELYRGPYDFATLAALAEGKETISGTEANIREGLVVRPLHERRSEVLAGRAIGKIVGDSYLLRKGGTEFN